MRTDGWMGRLVSLIFPARCACCGRVVPAGERICSACERQILRVTGKICPRCGRGREWCACGGAHRQFERCAAPFYYEGAARRGILRMKYANHPGAAAGFAAFIRETVEREYAGVRFDSVTAVPMFPAEQKARGFNQSALLGRELARALRLPYRETLRKSSAAKPQHRCTAAERWRNIRGAYEALPGTAGRQVLLVDDIVTTGATLDECAGALRRAGVGRVYCAAAACVRKTGKPLAPIYGKN